MFFKFGLKLKFFKENNHTELYADISQILNFIIEYIHHGLDLKKSKTILKLALLLHKPTYNFLQCESRKVNNTKQQVLIYILIQTMKPFIVDVTRSLCLGKIDRFSYQNIFLRWMFLR